MVGGLDDPPGWNHIDNAAAAVHAVEGTVEVEVNEVTNTGRFIARLTVPEGDLVLELDRFNEFNPCQDGGVAAFIYEHGDSGCGDTNWPKTLLYIAGWGFGHATLNGQLLHEDYQMHLMVTQGIRDREILEVNYPEEAPLLRGLLAAFVTPVRFNVNATVAYNGPVSRRL